MPPTLRLSGYFEQRDLGLLCRELELLQGLPSGTPVLVDLGGLTGLSTASLAVLVCTPRALRSKGVCDPLERFIPPSDQRLHPWLSRPALEWLLSIRAGRGPRDGGGAPTPRGCEPFTDSGGIDRAVAGFQIGLAERTGWSESALGSFGAMAADLAENVLQHSGAHGGVASLRIRAREQRVDLAIADCGIGIHRSIVQNPEYRDIPDDQTAIRTAIGPGATGEPGTGGGLGLFLARLVVRDNGGSFFVRSGDACRDEAEMVAEATRLANLHGTLISVGIRTDREFDYSRIEPRLTRPDGVAG
jgi:hypothetical protein